MPTDRIARNAAAAAASVRARRSPRIARWFTRYAGRYLRRNFHAFRIDRDGLPALPPGRPAIVYSNHPSWWDPLIFVAAAGHFFPGRPGYGPMDAAALAKYPFMERLGIFGIEPGTARGAADFLRIGTGLLADPDAMLWVTAEGGFTDPRTRPVRLRPGLAHLARRVPDVVLVPLAIEYPFWQERHPEALIRFGPAVPPPAPPDEPVETLAALLAGTMDRLAEAATGRDPRRFHTIAAGSAGIGGGYDLWRRARAALRGERFRPHHGDPTGDA